MALSRSDIETIVGSANVRDDADTLAAFSRDQSFVPPRAPDMVVSPQTTEQVQQILRLANTTRTPVIPCSSGLNLHGATIPDQGGILLDLSAMNNILALDEENWSAIIEPGVTYAQLQDYLGQKGYRIMVPFGVPPGRSVVSSYLERDPVLAAASFEHGNYLIMDTELVLPNGELFRTGNWTSGGAPGAPSGPIRNALFRMWTGAQGTLGIMTKMVVQISPVPARQRIFFAQFSELSAALAAVKQIQGREIGTECFLLNDFNVAAMCAGGWDVPTAFPADAVENPEFSDLRRQLPPWLLTVCVNGNRRRPDEKIAYETEALHEVCDSLNVRLLENLPNVPGAVKIMTEATLRPWAILKKFHYRGSVHDLTFKAPLKKTAALAATVEALARKHNYPAADIGAFLLPLERGRGMHCEFDLHASPVEGPQREAVRCLWMDASAQLLNSGAYFDRPYGHWAGLVYARSAAYTAMLKKLKAETDPNNILNPGKLCFT